MSFAYIFCLLCSAVGHCFFLSLQFYIILGCSCASWLSQQIQSSLVLAKFPFSHFAMRNLTQASPTLKSDKNRSCYIIWYRRTNCDRHMKKVWEWEWCMQEEGNTLKRQELIWKQHKIVHTKNNTKQYSKVGCKSKKRSGRKEYHNLETEYQYMEYFSMTEVM